MKEGRGRMGGRFPGWFGSGAIAIGLPETIIPKH